MLAQVLCGFLAVPLEGIAAASIADGGHASTMKKCMYSVNTSWLCLVPAEIDVEKLADTPICREFGHPLSCGVRPHMVARICTPCSGHIGGRAQSGWGQS